MPDAVWSQRYVLSMPSDAYLECYTCGAYVKTSNRVQHENFHKTFSNLRSEDMATVKWCDYGDHAFKAGQDGSASFEGTEYRDGVPVNTTMDACPKHNPMLTVREAARYELTPEGYEALTKDS